MKAKVIQFRRGRKTIHKRHFLIGAGMKNRKEALKLVGKEVEWRSPAGKIIKGKIAAAHGNKGIVRAIFEKGLPGQAITTDIEINERREVKERKGVKERKEVKQGKGVKK